jgi:hypothetical protein
MQGFPEICKLFQGFLQGKKVEKGWFRSLYSIQNNHLIRRNFLYSSAVEQMKLNLTDLMFPVAYVGSRMWGKVQSPATVQSVLKETELALSEDMIRIPGAHTLGNVSRYHPSAATTRTHAVGPVLTNLWKLNITPLTRQFAVNFYVL